MSPWGTGAGSFFSSGISVTSASVATWIGHKPGRRRLWTRTDGLIGTAGGGAPIDVVMRHVWFAVSVPKEVDIQGPGDGQGEEKVNRAEENPS